MDLGLNGATVVVAGGTSGVGRAAAECGSDTTDDVARLVRSPRSSPPRRNSYTTGQMSMSTAVRTSVELRAMYETERRTREFVMREHRYSFDVDATPEEIWSIMHQRPTDLPSGRGEIGEFGRIRRTTEHGPVTIEILHEGDEHCDGLVRHCFFRVPKYLLTGGVAQSWEHVTDVVPYQSAKYYSISKPLWSRAEGEHRLEPLPDGRTRVHFVERYHVYNPLMRLILERPVFQFISNDNDKAIRDGIVGALAEMRRGAQASESS